MKLSDFEIDEMVGYCPKCHHELVIRDGRYGKFIGCVNFPKCRKTFDYEDFRVQPVAIEMKKLDNAETYEDIMAIMENTEFEQVRHKASEKLLKENICTCGRKARLLRVYRTTPDYPHYLKQYRCPKCGDYVTEETRNYASFVRMGRIDEGGDDSHITGGYWL